MLLFDISPRLFNSFIHQSFGNSEFLGIYHNPERGEPMYVIMALAMPLLPSAFRERVLV